MIHICRVCGYFDEDMLPWGNDGNTPSFELCPCCNVEFGYEDSTIFSIHKYREKWINSEKFKSDEKYLSQMKNIDEKYL